MKRLSKNQVSEFAIIHISIHASVFDSNALMDAGISEKEKERIVRAVHRAAKTLSNGRPLNLGSSELILNWVRQNVK